MSTEMERFFKREETLEERLIAAGLGYPLSKEDAVKAYKSMLVFKPDTPEMLDCELCFGVGHDFDAGLPCVLCCEPAKPVLDLIRKNADLQAKVAGLNTGYEAYERVNAELRAECEALKEKYEAARDRKNSITALQAENEALRKDASLHVNLQRAAGELPGAWSIDVSVERHAGWVSLLDGDGCEFELSGEGHLGEQVSEALEVALEMSKESAQ